MRQSVGLRQGVSANAKASGDYKQGSQWEPKMGFHGSHLVRENQNKLSNPSGRPLERRHRLVTSVSVDAIRLQG